MLFGGQVYYLWNHLTTNMPPVSPRVMVDYLWPGKNGICYTGPFFHDFVPMDRTRLKLESGVRTRKRVRQPLFCSSESRNDERCEEQQ